MGIIMKSSVKENFQNYVLHSGIIYYAEIINLLLKGRRSGTSIVSGSEAMKENIDKLIYFEEKEKQFKSKMGIGYGLGVHRK